MKEELLHYVWKTKSFQFTNLRTTEGQTLHIDQFGVYNLNAGPDFLQGKITLGKTQWIGHIELHVLSSDWIRHNHETDQAYQNVILHVVWEEDEVIYLQDGTRVPCIELKGLIPEDFLQSYDRFSRRPDKITCSEELKLSPKTTFLLQLNRMYVERLEEKCHPIALELESNQNDWSQTLFVIIAKCFGLKVNAAGMEAMARKIPINLLAKHGESVFQLEALMYGQAGMLSSSWLDRYPKKLRSEYIFLTNKYKLKGLSGKEWKLSKMRPSSFPTIRISQLANLYGKNKDLHADILHTDSLESLYSIFQIEASSYWDNHYLFDKESIFQDKIIGKSTINNILINGIIPFLFAYGQYRSEDQYVERALKFAEEIAPEENRIVRNWKKYDVRLSNALETQGLLQLQKHYCDKKRCLECSFGNKVLKSISKKVTTPLLSER